MKKNKFRYCVFRLNDALTEIVVEKKSDGFDNVSWEDFISNFGDNACRYGACILDYDAGDDGVRSKVVFMTWAPDTAKTKEKMVYASSKDAIKKVLMGIQLELQGTEKPEVAKTEVVAKCKLISK